jgi:heptosyltransferase I
MPLIDTPLDRVCIVMLGAAGDVVHTLPVVAALKRHQPTCRISWILQPGPASLLRGHPDVDEIIIFRRSEGWRGFRQLRAELKTREFDITLAMQIYLKAGIITAMTRAPIKLGYDRARSREFTWIFNTVSLPAREQRHHQDQFLEFAEALGLPTEPLEWKLGPWESELPWRDEFRARFDRPVAAIVIGASRPEREWIAERWAAVVRSLYDDYGMAPVLVGGTSQREIDTQETVMRESAVPVASTLGEPFRRLVSILDSSALVISPNTGPLHIAVALNRPTISLNAFGNPKRVGPYRRFLDLMIDEYGDPGEDYPITWKNRPGRMERISVQAVLGKVLVWQRRYKGAGP